jgi:hypothetical protein
MWAHVLGDTVRFESLTPLLFTFTGRTRYSLSAFGEHLINEEVERAIASSLSATGSAVRDWHMGLVFNGAASHHVLVIEFDSPPSELGRFRAAFDEYLAEHNADYRAHRTPGAGFPAPSVVAAAAGSFESWMRARGKLGGQHKVPRMDPTGVITGEILNYLGKNEAAKAAFG